MNNRSVSALNGLRPDTSALSTYLLAIIIACTLMHQVDASLSFDVTGLVPTWYNFHARYIPQARTTKIKAIIFDIDGVLSCTNKMQAFYDIGLGTTLNFIYDQQKFPSEKLLFDTLAGVPAQSSYTSYTKGLQLPQIMVDWQTGAQTNAQIQDAIINYLKASNFPASQKNWVEQSVMMMTTPKRFIGTRQTIPANVDLLHQLKDCGYKLYILSNWDKESFALFCTQFPEIFMHQGTPTFDGIMISGNVGTLKPELSIFNLCLEKFGLQAEKSLFIDDEPANIAAAQLAGMHTVLAQPSDPYSVRKNLVKKLQS